VGLPKGFAFPLDGRVVLVTGGASGIGRATALMALAGGAKVAAVDINQDALASLRREAGVAGDRFITDIMDVTNRVHVEKSMSTIKDALGTIDGLVCSAGTSIEVPLLAVTPEIWNRVVDLNLDGTFYVAQAMARDLIASGKPGSIVTIASAQAFRGRQNSVAYVASKAGVSGLTKALALDLAPNGIRVNCVAPGAVETPLMRSIVDKAPGGIEQSLSRIPMGRFGQPEDLAASVCFLLSDAAAWTTGQTLHVNGGSLIV
jgi:NAD(P)-dependent dehydrogenase (short-subunit alcohol dehydrogenase family)